MNIFQILMLIIALLVGPGVIVAGILWALLDTEEDDPWYRY